MAQKTHISLFFVVLVDMLFMVNTPGVYAQQIPLHTLPVKNNKDLHRFFAYTGDGSVIISGHRGAREKGYPENSLAGFDYVLTQMPAFFEIDPRLTKDSVIVLMHDATLDRTTTGKGKVGEYTWGELQSFRLKDSDGNITEHGIPTLEEVIVWSKGKTVVNLDKKDVPLWMIVDLIKKHDAVNHVMLTVHNGQEARYYYEHFPRIMFSAFVRNWSEYTDMDRSGVPWKNMIAYVGPSLKKEQADLYQALRAKGVRCMVSFSPTHDRLETVQERTEAYKKEIILCPDIIESDIPTEVWSSLPRK